MKIYAFALGAFGLLGLLLNSVSAHAGSKVIDRVQKVVEITNPSTSLSCSYGEEDGFVPTRVFLDAYSLPKEIVHSPAEVEKLVHMSAPGVKCAPYEKEIADQIAQAGGRLRVPAAREVSLYTLAMPTGCELHLSERIEVQVGSIEFSNDFSNSSVTFIRKLPGLSYEQCRQHIPTGF